MNSTGHPENQGSETSILHLYPRFHGRRPMAGSIHSSSETSFDRRVMSRVPSIETAYLHLLNLFMPLGLEAIERRRLENSELTIATRDALLQEMAEKFTQVLVDHGAAPEIFRDLITVGTRYLGTYGILEEQVHAWGADESQILWRLLADHVMASLGRT